MQSTLLMLLATVAAAGCATPVGSDCTGARCGDYDNAAAGDCTNPKTVSTAVTIASESDFAKLPNGCWSLNAKLRIQGSAITSLAGLGRLVEVNDLEIVDTNLTTIDVSERIKVYGSALIRGNKKLTGLANLDIRRWDGATDGAAFEVSYIIRDNAVLEDIEGLRYIVKVDEDLVISGNPKLTELGFADLTRVGGKVTVTNNTELDTCEAVEIDHCATTGSITISGNKNSTVTRSTCNCWCD